MRTTTVHSCLGLLLLGGLLASPTRAQIRGYESTPGVNHVLHEIDPDTGLLVRSPLSRQKPFSTFLGVRWERPDSRWWAQAEWGYAAKEDRLSLRDQTDTSRIPPGGTPSWSVVNLRGGVRLGGGARVGLSLENLFDENYRIHGSGQNEPGFNVVLMAEVSF